MTAVSDDILCPLPGTSRVQVLEEGQGGTSDFFFSFETHHFQWIDIHGAELGNAFQNFNVNIHIQDGQSFQKTLVAHNLLLSRHSLSLTGFSKVKHLKAE